MKRTTKVTLEFSEDELKNFLCSSIEIREKIIIYSVSFNTERKTFVFEGVEGQATAATPRPEFNLSKAMGLTPAKSYSKRKPRQSRGLKTFIEKEMEGEVQYPLERLFEKAIEAGIPTERGTVRYYLRHILKATEIHPDIYQLKASQVIH